MLALVGVLANWDAASSLARRFGNVPGGPPGGPPLSSAAKEVVTRFILCAAILLSAFHSLALVEILSGWPALRIDLAAVLSLTVAIVLRLAASSARPDSFRPARSTAADLLRRASQLLRQHPPLIALSLSVAWVHGLLLTSVFSAPPRGFDALWYHLPNALRWYRSQALGLHVGSYIEYYPGNGELLALPLFTIANDSWLGLLQYPWLLITALVVSLLARRGGASPAIGMAAGLTASTVPLLVYQAMHFYVDVICAALSIGSLLYVIDWIRSRRTTDLVLCALTLGLMLGTKYVAIVWWIFVASAALIASRGEKSSADGRASSPITAMALVGIIVFSGTAFTWIWWLRNVLATGNPIEPIHVKFLLRVLLEGKPLSTVFAAADTRSYTELLRAFGSSFGGAAILVLAAPVAALGLVRGNRTGPTATAITLSLAYLAWGLTAAALFLTNDPRFVIGPVLVAAVPVAAWSKRHPRKVLYLFCAIALVNTVTVTHRIALADDFEVSFNGRSRNVYYGLLDEIDALPNGSRVLLRGHPAMVYPASGAKRQNIVYPSPMGPVADEIEQWGIQYVLARSPEPEDIAALTAQPRLHLMHSQPWPNHHWWDYWPLRRAQISALYRVAP